MKSSVQVLRRLVLVAVFAAPLSSCQSPSTSNEPKAPECKCGTEEHDVLGCPAPCSTGKVECSNPLCTCGPAEAPAKPAESATSKSSK